MIDYIALELLDIPYFIDRGITYKTRFLLGFLMFNFIIIISLFAMMICMHHIKFKRQAKKEHEDLNASIHRDPSTATDHGVFAMTNRSTVTARSTFQGNL